MTIRARTLGPLALIIAGSAITGCTTDIDPGIYPVDGSLDSNGGSDGTVDTFSDALDVTDSHAHDSPLDSTLDMGTDTDTTWADAGADGTVVGSDSGTSDSGSRDAATDGGTPDGMVPDASVQTSAWPNLNCALPQLGSVPPFSEGRWRSETVDSRAELVGQAYATPYHGSGTTISVLSDDRVAIGYFTNEFVCSSEAGALGWAVSSQAGWTLSNQTCNQRGYWPVASVDHLDRVNLIFSGAAPNNPHWTYLSSWSPTAPAAWSGAVDSYVSSLGRTATVMPDCDGNRIVATDGDLRFGPNSDQPPRIATLARGSYRPFLARDGQGRLHIAQDIPVPTGPSSAVYSSRYWVSEGTSLTMSDLTGGVVAQTLGLAVLNGQPIIVYRTHDATINQTRVKAAVQAEDGTWTTEDIGALDTDTQVALAVGENEAFLMIGAAIYRRTAPGTWTSNTFSALSSARFPSMTVDRHGRLHVAFYRVGSRAGSNRDFPSSVHYAVFE